jgi:ribonuclease R
MELELDLAPPAEKIKAGDWVVASPPGLDGQGKEPEAGRVLSCLGGDDTPNLDTIILVKRAGIPEEFSAACLAEASSFGADVPAGAAQGRLDLRGKVVFTIDGEDARDFDDAVSIEENKDGWILGVHIADVSEYVQPGSALDQDALKRGTSTYLPDHVVPMLPEALSNGLCSLNPQVDRLTVSAVMEISRNGALGPARFYRSIIHSSRRCTYNEIEEFLAGGKALSGPQGESVGKAARVMEKAARVRLAQRVKRGALDFNFPETRCELDGQGKPVRLFRAERLFAHQLIEEFMLAANESVAAALHKKGIEFLFRIHEKPDTEKLAGTLQILARLKAGLKGMNREDPSPAEIQKLLASVAGTPLERTAQTLLLRSLRLARYAPQREGHFGLALADYAHFTSPIRRYPDLHVHRRVKALLCEGKSKPAADEMGSVEALGLHCSTLERRAERVERDCIKAKQIRYLQDHLGERYTATVVSVGSFGYFAEIDAFPAEGLVRMGRLVDDLYSFDEDHWCLRGLNRGRQIRIGEKVEIEVERADWESLQVDFAPADSASPPSIPRPAHKNLKNH